MSPAACRFCGGQLQLFVDLGMSPLANSYLTEPQLTQMEPFYPLRALVCADCLLVQLEEFEQPENIFSSYAYFSSFSVTWLEHCRAYVEMIVARLRLGTESKVVEVASNDGYLLQYFVARGIPVLGVEPAENVARVAVERGVPTVTTFFGRGLAEELARDGPADLVVANNVLAHVPGLVDFVTGLEILLASGGTLTAEFPHLLRLIAGVEFDTIYHEHLSYFSLLSITRVFEQAGLEIYDVEELETHGGSLRIYACHAGERAQEERVLALVERELSAGLGELAGHMAFAGRVHEAKRELLGFLIESKADGKTIVGYGAPAKATTLLNFCGIGTDFIDYTVDISPHKQGLFLPGTHIPIRAPGEVRRTRPDLLFILPWNIRDEVMEQMSFIREWGGRFVTRLPKVEVLQ